MRRLTLAQVKDPASGIARVLNVPPSDSRFVGYVNEAYEALVEEMKSAGTVWRYQICVTDGCITFPRQIAAIEAVAVCDQPLTIRNQWFEFLDSGFGLQGDGSCGSGACNLQLLERSPACTFADIRGSAKQIRVYADVAEEAGAKILLQGYDDNNNWIRTETAPGNGIWQDGEKVTISTAPTNSTKFFSALTGVQKPITNGSVRLYEYDTVLLTQRAMAVYEPDETTPWYRRSLIPGLSALADNGDDECESVSVVVMAKLDFIPLRNDTDYLVISSIPALKDMCQSVRKGESNLANEAAEWHMRAIRKLHKQTRHYKGDGAVSPIRMPRREVWGASVENMI